MAFTLYVAYIHQKTEPGVLMGLRSVNEPMADGERAFCFACLHRAITENELPVTVRNFVKPKAEGK